MGPAKNQKIRPLFLIDPEADHARVVHRACRAGLVHTRGPIANHHDACRWPPHHDTQFKTQLQPRYVPQVKTVGQTGDLGWRIGEVGVGGGTLHASARSRWPTGATSTFPQSRGMAMEVAGPPSPPPQPFAFQQEGKRGARVQREVDRRPRAPAVGLCPPPSPSGSSPPRSSPHSHPLQLPSYPPGPARHQQFVKCFFPFDLYIYIFSLASPTVPATGWDALGVW